MKLASITTCNLASLLLVTLAGWATPIPVGTGTNHAEVVINFSDGGYYEFEISFDDPGSTGIDLLDRIETETSLTTLRTDFGGSLGIAIDEIRFMGHADTTDFDTSFEYWNYWTRDTPMDPWGPSVAGASSRIVPDGGSDGWVFSLFEAQPPMVPEPSAMGLMALGWLGLMAYRRWR